MRDGKYNWAYLGCKGADGVRFAPNGESGVGARERVGTPSEACWEAYHHLTNGRRRGTPSGGRMLFSRPQI